MISTTREGSDVGAALAAVACAETLIQLRQLQAILIPALTGASLETTAAILGLSKHRLRALRRKFRLGETAGPIDKTRGGRRRFLLSIDDERRLLLPWLNDLHGGGKIPVGNIHRTYEEVVGRKVAKSTIYRLLARHGWSRQGQVKS